MLFHITDPCSAGRKFGVADLSLLLRCHTSRKASAGERRHDYRLYRRSWVRFLDASLLTTILPPGEAAEGAFRLDRSLPAGEYRFRTEIEYLDTGALREMISRTFQLTG